MEWIKTADRPPTMQDANWIGHVLTVVTGFGKPLVDTWRWETVAKFPEKFPYWMHHPKAPEMEEV